jgi:hypothetical protein
LSVRTHPPPPALHPGAIVDVRVLAAASCRGVVRIVAAVAADPRWVDFDFDKLGPFRRGEVGTFLASLEGGMLSDLNWLPAEAAIEEVGGLLQAR